MGRIARKPSTPHSTAVDVSKPSRHRSPAGVVGGVHSRRCGVRKRCWWGVGSLSERARNLHRQGKRVGGRWERGSVDIGSSANSATWQGHMKRAGYVLDITERAAAKVQRRKSWQMPTLRPMT